MSQAVSFQGVVTWARWLMPSFVVCGLVLGVTFWVIDRGMTVVEVRDVGEAVAAVHAPSSFGVSATSVETAKGTFAVAGLFQLLKGSQLVIETRKNGDLHLCDHSQVADPCKKLLD